MHTETVPETADIGTLATARSVDTLGYARVSTAASTLRAPNRGDCMVFSTGRASA